MENPTDPDLLAAIARGDVALLQWEAFKRDWQARTAALTPAEREQAMRELLEGLGIF